MIRVAIPSVGLSDRLGPLVRGLAMTAGVEVVVYCNGNQMDLYRLCNLVEAERQNTLHDLDMLGKRRVRSYREEWPWLAVLHEGGIYSVWNRAMDDAETDGASCCVILNDDVQIEPTSVWAAEAILAGGKTGIVGWDPTGPLGGVPRAVTPVIGTYRQGGITGFAFAVNPYLGVRCDERFGWWGGDDDLVWTFLQRGLLAVRMQMVGVNHPLAGGTSSRQRPEVLESVEADEKLLFEKWGKSWAR